jgi:hypothetical protein
MGSPNQGANGNSPSQTPIGGVTGALYGNINEDTAAPTIDQSGVNKDLATMGGDTASQQSTLDQENQMAAGKGPSAATALLQQQTAQTTSNADALASSGSGGSGAGASRRQAMMTGAGATQQMGGQAATARAQEQIGAMGAAAGQEQNMAGNQLQAAGLQGGLAQSQAQIDQQNQQLSQNAQLANQKANEGTGNQILGAASSVASAVGGLFGADIDFMEPAPPGSKDKNGAPPAHFTFREERGGPNHLPFMALIDRTTGRAMKIATEQLTPSEHHQLYAPHAAGALDSPNRQTAEMHDMNMGQGMPQGQQQQPSLANANMGGQTGSVTQPVGGGGWQGPTGPGGGGGKMYGDGDMSDDPRFAEMVRRAHPALYHAANGPTKTYGDIDSGPTRDADDPEAGTGVRQAPAKPAQQQRTAPKPAAAPAGHDPATPNRYSTPDDEGETIRKHFENGATLGGRKAGSAADYHDPNYGEADLNRDMYRSTMSGYGPDTSMGHRGPDPEDQPGSDADWDKANDLAMASPTNPKSRQEYDAQAKAATARWTDRKDSPEEAVAKAPRQGRNTGQKIADFFVTALGGGHRGPSQQQQPAQQQQPQQQPQRRQQTQMPQGPWTPPPAGPTAPSVQAPSVQAPDSPPMAEVPTYTEYSDGEAGASADAAPSGGSGGGGAGKGGMFDAMEDKQADVPLTFPGSVSAPLAPLKDGEMGGNYGTSSHFNDGEMSSQHKDRHDAPPYDDGAGYDQEQRPVPASTDDPGLAPGTDDWMPSIVSDAEGHSAAGQSNGKSFDSPLAKTMGKKKPQADPTTDDAGRYPEENDAISRINKEDADPAKLAEKARVNYEDVGGRLNQHDEEKAALLRQTPTHTTHEGNRARRRQNHPAVFMDLDAKERTGAGSKEDPMESDSWEAGTEDNPVDLDEDTPENQQGARESRDSFTGRVPKAHTEYSGREPMLDWGKGPDPAHDAFLQKQAAMFKAMNPYVEVKPKPALAMLFPAKKAQKAGPTDWMTALHESNAKYDAEGGMASAGGDVVSSRRDQRAGRANAIMGAGKGEGLVPGEIEEAEMSLPGSGAELELSHRIKSRKAVHGLLEQWKRERGTKSRYADGDMGPRRSALASTMKRKKRAA